MLSINSVVEIKDIELTPDRVERFGKFGSAKANFQSPQIGDSGTIVNVYDPDCKDPHQSNFTVECVQNDKTVWVENFSFNELKLIDKWPTF